MTAIQFIRPNAEFSMTESNVEWLDATQTEPSQQEIEQAWVAYQAKVAEDKAEAEAKKAAAQAKLAALGLTTDDLEALGLGGN